MIKKILIGLGILILLLIVGIAIFLLTFDLNNYRKFAQDQLSHLLHQPVIIKSMETKLALVPTIEIQKIQTANLEQDGPILTIPKIEVTLEIMPLLFKQKLNIQKINLDEIQFTWNKPQTNDKKAQEAEKPTPNVPETGKKASTFFDVSKQLWIATINVKKINGSIKDGDKVYPILLENTSITGLSKFQTTVTYQDNPINISGSVGSLLKLLSKPDSLSIDLSIKQQNANVTINGKVGDLKAWDKMQFNITANIPKVQELAQSWKITLPKWLNIPLTGKLGVKGNLDQMEVTVLDVNLDRNDLTLLATGKAANLLKNPTINLNIQTAINGKVAKALKLKPMSLEANTTLNKSAIALSDIKWTAEQSDLNGFIRVQTQQTPINIQTELNSKYFNIQDLIDFETTPSPKQNTKNATQQVQNDLPWDILTKVDLSGKIQLNHLALWEKVNDYAVLTLQPTLKNGILTSTIQSRLLAGNINSALRLNAHQKNAQLKLETGPINLDRIKAISKDVQGVNVILNTSLESNGKTMDELVQNSQGSLTLELLDGTIVNKWFNTLPNLLKESKNNANIYSAADAQTKVLCGAINVTLANGQIKSKNQITLQTDILNFVVNGDIDLAKRTLDLNMLPAWAKADGITNKVLALTQAISIKGPWNDISVDISASKAIQNLIKSVWNSTTSQNEFFYCERALKRPLTKLNADKKTSKTPTKQKTTSTDEKTKNESFKAQLVDSLAQAILKKAK